MLSFAFLFGLPLTVTLNYLASNFPAPQLLDQALNNLKEFKDYNLFHPTASRLNAAYFSIGKLLIFIIIHMLILRNILYFIT